MNRGRVYLWAMLTVALGLSVSACSSSGGGKAVATPPSPVSERATVGPSPTPTSSSPAKSASPTPLAVAGGEIRVTLKNNTFPEEIRVKVGAKVVFLITNQGDETHTFEAPDLDIHKEINPGQTVRFEWVVPNKKGEWDMGCFLTDPPLVHDGMEGTLIIE